MRQHSLCFSSQCFLLSFSAFLGVAASELRSGAAQIRCPTPEYYRGLLGVLEEYTQNGLMGGVQKKNFPLRKYLQSDACVRPVSSRSISSCQRSVSIPWCPIPGQKAKHSLAMIRVV